MDTLPPNPLKIFPLASNMFIPYFCSLSALVLELFLQKSLWLLCYGCLDILKELKMFTFSEHFKFGEEPDAA